MKVQNGKADLSFRFPWVSGHPWARTETPTWAAISRVWAPEAHGDKDKKDAWAHQVTDQWLMPPMYVRAAIISFQRQHKDLHWRQGWMSPTATELTMGVIQRNQHIGKQLSGKHRLLFFLLIHFLMDLLLPWLILKGYISCNYSTFWELLLKPHTS